MSGMPFIGMYARQVLRDNITQATILASPPYHTAYI